MDDVSIAYDPAVRNQISKLERLEGDELQIPLMDFFELVFGETTTHLKRGAAFQKRRYIRVPVKVVREAKALQGDSMVTVKQVSDHGSGREFEIEVANPGKRGGHLSLTATVSDSHQAWDFQDLVAQGVQGQ